MRFSPIARSTTAGPATITWAVCRVITARCDATRRAAGKPATAPSAAETTGAVSMARPIERKRCVVYTASPGGRGPLPPFAPTTLPPAPSRKRTSGSLY